MLRKLLLVAVAVSCCFAADKKTPSRVPTASKVFIAPMDGNLNGFIAPEIIKKKVPLTVVTDEKDAEYILTGASVKADDKWYHSVFGGKDSAFSPLSAVSTQYECLVSMALATASISMR
jgi:hypothetical protein